jgi:3-hydroxyisobutyrate dehydrogenase-like beta-hydroxyacid dehydrogenase
MAICALVLDILFSLTKIPLYMAQLGFIGLGVMGSRIVRRLLDAGHVVYATNRTRSRAASLIAQGMHWRDTPRQVAEAAATTFSMVSDSAALLSIAQGDDGVVAGLAPDKVYVDMSTVSPTASRRVATQAASRDARMLDAPVSGSVPAVEGGTLVFFVGGDAETLERVRPILNPLGQRIIHVGANGQGVAMKIAINLNLATQLLSLFESLVLAEKAGIPRELALDALLNSVAASPHLKYRAPFAFNPPAEAWFSVKMMKKDLRLALELGDELNVPLTSVSSACDALDAAAEMGFGDEDFAAMFRAVETIANQRRPVGDQP